MLNDNTCCCSHLRNPFFGSSAPYHLLQFIIYFAVWWSSTSPTLLAAYFQVPLFVHISKTSSYKVTFFIFGNGLTISQIASGDISSQFWIGIKSLGWSPFPSMGSLIFYWQDHSHTRLLKEQIIWSSSSVASTISFDIVLLFISLSIAASYLIITVILFAVPTGSMRHGMEKNKRLIQVENSLGELKKVIG